MVNKPIKTFVITRQFQVETLFASRMGATRYSLIKDVTLEKPELLVFCGGADINPALYGERPLFNTRIDQHRDDLDLRYYNQYPNIPKVGICRGGQFLNVMSGGTLFQHVDNHGGDHIMHNLLNIPGKFLEKKMMVTSTHHQMMVPGPLGTVLGIAVSEDKSKGRANVYESATGREPLPYDTEVVWYPQTRSLCYQPHPEYNSAQFYFHRQYFFDLIDHFFWDKF